MDNIIMENNQLKQVPATTSNAIDDDDDDPVSHSASTTKRASITDTDVSKLLLVRNKIQID